MKRGLLSIFVVICQIFGVTPAFAVDVNNFYFDNFTGDYYLSKDAEGISHLRVVESVTAVFPNYNQNKGICRQIPYTNQGGANITLESLTRGNLTLTRNGAHEPIYSIEKSNGYFNVCTGTEEYVLGRQTYTFEYEFERVVTDFENYQELYWDTNGTGASQTFGSVVARVHFDDGVLSDFTGNAWCYVGRYGESGQGRCAIFSLDDGVGFSATGLKAHENLTFDVEIKPETFNVPAPRRSYVLVFVMVGAGILCLLLLIIPVRKFIKAGEKRKFWKNYFVKPEYQPHAEYSVAEMAEVYLGKKHDAKVAVLLDLVVRKKVELIKEGTSKRRGWKIKVLDLDGVTEEAKIMLTILNNRVEPEVGEVIEVKTRTATSELIALGKKYERTVVAKLKQHGLVEEKYQAGTTMTAGVWILTALCFGFPFVMMAFVMAEEFMSGVDTGVGYLVGVEVFPTVMVIELVVTVVVWVVLAANTKKYAVRTEKGLATSRYMDGVKLYIKMAEAERLKFMQSVEGADTSAEGIVHLYEKLLPYAAVLGLEESWMEELERYYKMENVAEPGWYHNGLTVRDMYYASALASSYSRSSTTMSSSDSGSSGGSGGGGGGFSGGGGGGGGFSGR